MLSKDGTDLVLATEKGFHVRDVQYPLFPVIHKTKPYLLYKVDHIIEGNETVKIARIKSKTP